MKISELKKLLQPCNDDWDICYPANYKEPDDGVVNIDKLNEDPNYPRTYILF